MNLKTTITFVKITCYKDDKWICDHPIVEKLARGNPSVHHN